MTAETKIEYAGGLKFGPAEDEPIKESMTLDDWMRRSTEEYWLKGAVVSILNSTDEELEQSIRNADNQDQAMETNLALLETCCRWLDTYKAGVDVMASASCRLQLVLERIVGKEEMEEIYADAEPGGAS